MRYPIVSFNAGELSPMVDARSDADKYRSGCRTLENMIARIYGAAERRPGTKYIDTCDGVARVMPFIYSNSIAYILLFEDLRLYFYYDGGRVLDALGRRLKVDTPYLAADLFEIQYKQLNDVMWLTHGNYAPRKLSRTTATSFTVTEITFNDGPFQTRNDVAKADGVTMTPSVTTGSGTLTASSATFAAGHVGALFSVTQPRVNTAVTGSLTSPATGVIGAALPVEGEFTWNTYGTWTGTALLQRSINGATWETYSTVTGTNNRQAQLTAIEEEDNVQYRINVTSLSSGTIGAELTVNSSTQTGIGRVTGYVSPTQVTMTVLKNFASTNADVRWAEGCWSTYRGFPRCVTFFEDRAIYAGTNHQPQTVWFSASGDYENFEEDTYDDSSFSLTLASDTRNAILWISALDGLIVGTAGSEWRIRSSAYDEPLTPTNFSCRQQTTYGSKAIQALPVNDAILFVDRVGRKVREISYDNTRDKNIAPDLTIWAEHVTNSGITSIAYQKSPDPILWATRADGTLLSMTYEREQDVIAWSRHPFYVGLGTEGETSTTTTVKRYPTLQALAAADIPAAPTPPAEIALSSPIGVADATALAAMTAGNHYTIQADIDLTGVAWTPLAFNSASDTIIEGNGHTISNLSVSAPGSDNQAFIGTIAGAGDFQLRNLTFSDCTVAGRDSVGIVIAKFEQATGQALISNVDCTNCTITAARKDCGTITGYSRNTDDVYYVDCTVTDCNITLTGGAWEYGGNYGGFIGRMTHTYGYGTADSGFVNCHVVGGTMTNANEMPLSCGGFAGHIEGSDQLTDTYADVTDGRTIIVYSCSSSMDLILQGDATQTGLTYPTASCGGFFGTAASTLFVSSAATGGIDLITSADWGVNDWIGSVGGFGGVAWSQVQMIDCSSTGTITAPDGGATVAQLTAIGGFLGEVGADTLDNYHNAFLRCYSTTDIVVASDPWYASKIGGFVGYWHCSSGGTHEMKRCWSEGDITLTGTFNATGPGAGPVGGFVGYIYQTDPSDALVFEDCYTWTSITTTATNLPANSLFAGFVGEHREDEPGNAYTRCYVAQTDNVYGSGYTGQIPAHAGSYGFGSVTDTIADIAVTGCFYDTQTSSLSTSEIGEGHDTDWLQTQSNFEAAGWDFATLWTMPPVTTTIDYSAEGLGPNSVAVIPSATEDEVWLVVARVIGGTIVRYLEQVQPRRVANREDLWFVDAGLAYDGVEDTTFSGLDHLEGEELVVWADGAVQPRQTVSGGAITLAEAATRVIVGLPFRYKLQPMRFDLQVDGTTKGTLKRFAELVISFYESLNVEYGEDVDHLFPIDWRTDEAMGDPTDLHTGDKVVTCEGGFSPEDPLVISSDDPTPCTIRALIPRLDVTGR